MTKIVSYNSCDYAKDNSVPVIASFDSKGHIAPLYVRIAGVPYKIDSYWTSYTFRNVVNFNCKIIDNDYLKPLSLTFYREEGVWTIPR